MTLNYANGAQEPLTPNLDSSGLPTGTFATPPGSSYAVAGISSGTPGQWQALTITWKDQTHWQLTPAAGVYVLRQITNRLGKSVLLDWNGSRQLSTITDSATNTVLLTLNYDGNGNLSTLTDTYGRKIVYNFGVPSGVSTVCLLSASQIAAVADVNPASRWTYNYTAFAGEPLLSSITVPSPTGTGNAVCQIKYDTSTGDSIGRVTSTVDGNGNQRAYTYNVGSTIAQIKDKYNKIIQSWTQNFDSAQRDIGITDVVGHSTSIVYGDSANPNLPTNVTDRNGYKTQYTYDAFGNVLTITDPRSVVTTYSYNYSQFPLGRLMSIQEGTNQPTPRTPINFTYYEPSGLTHTLTGPAPGTAAGGATVTTTYTYDSLGNILTVNTPGNNATVVGGVDQGVTSTFNYTSDPGDAAHGIGAYSQQEALGQPLTVTDSLGKVTHFRYGARGLLQSVFDSLGHEIDFGDTTASHAGGYNLADQPLLVTYPATGQTGSGYAHTLNSYLYVGGPLTNTAAYDESNSMTSFRQVSTAYGPEGEILSVTATDASHPVTYTYDGLYRTKTFADGNGSVTKYFYNPLGYLASVLYPSDTQHPNRDTAQFPSHDPNGNTLQRVDGRGVVTNYVYNDPESLLTDVQYPSTPGLNVHYDYDTYGRLLDLTDSAFGTFNVDGTVNTPGKTFGYDEADLVSTIQTRFRTPTGGLLPTQTQSYLYWPNGSRQSAATPAGAFSYNYDKVGRLQTLTNPFSEATNWLYQDNGWLQSLTLGNGVSTAYSFDAGGKLLDLAYQKAGTTIADFSVPATSGYDSAGNRLSVSVNLPLAGLPAGYSGPATYYSGTTNYQYDQRNQLLQEQSTRLGTSMATTNYTYTYQYDLAGNPTTFRGVTVGTGGFNANNQSSATGFSFDQNGNPISYKGIALAFDAENHLLTSGH